MNLSVRPATDKEWDRAARSPWATPFHSRTWYRYWNPGATAVVIDERWTWPLAPGPRRWWLPASQLSSPGFTYGGPLPHDPEAATATPTACAALADVLGDVQFRWNPHLGEPAALSGFTRADDTTWWLAPSEDRKRRYSKGHRAAVTRATRDGVTVRRAQTEADHAAYLELYRDTVRRWGNRAGHVYADAALLGVLGLPDAALWLAEVAGAAVAGAVVIETPHHWTYWHGAARESALHLQPVHGLLDAVIGDAARHEVAVFDFNPSGGHTQVDTFKRGFGAEPRECPMFEATRKRRRAVRWAKAQLHALAARWSRG